MDAKIARGRTYPSTHVETGIRIKGSAYEAFVKQFGKIRTKRFRLGTDLDVMRAWRASAFRGRAKSKEHWPSKVTPRSRELGYTYLYFVRARSRVKIGVAVDPRERFKGLQVGSGERLTFMGAIAAHKTLEPLIHQRFAADRSHCEWFELSRELRLFIEHVVTHGRNPVDLLWTRDDHWPDLDPQPLSAFETPSGTGHFC